MLHCDDVAEGDHFWMQTLGPVWITPVGWTGTDCPGIVAHYRDVYAWIQGEIKPAAGVTVETGYQRIGYLISRTETDYGGCFVMLQLE